MTEKELTCVVCPNGCRIKCTLDDGGKLISVTDFTCKRGESYATQELTHPMRTLTSTVRAEIGGKSMMLPVRTSVGIPKEKLFEAIAEIRKITLTSPVRTGDVIVPDFIEKGTNLIACKNAE